MARRKKDPVDGAQENTANELGELAAAVAVANDPGIADAFSKFEQGGKYYQVFQKAMKGEIKRLASGGAVEEEAENLSDVLADLGEELEAFQAFVRSLSNERLFAVLNIVTRNFGGTPIPPPPANNGPAAPQTPAPPPAPQKPAEQPPAQRKTTLKKKFAAANAHEVAPGATSQPAPAPASANQPAAPTMPPRGNRITGLF